MALFTLLKPFIDFLLPESEVEVRLRAITAEEVARKLVAKKTDEEISFFDYRDPLIREMLLSLKFRRNVRMAEVFADALYDHLLEELGDLMSFSAFDKPLLVPIPLSPARLRERGYNQTELIARALCERAGSGVFEFAPQALERIKNTPPQTSLPDKKAREENIRGAFAVPDAARIAGRNIILLDDIMTTGSTLREAASTLRAAGAKQIFCIAIAH